MFPGKQQASFARLWPMAPATRSVPAEMNPICLPTPSSADVVSPLRIEPECFLLILGASAHICLCNQTRQTRNEMKKKKKTERGEERIIPNRRRRKGERSTSSSAAHILPGQTLKSRWPSRRRPSGVRLRSRTITRARIVSAASPASGRYQMSADPGRFAPSVCRGHGARWGSGGSGDLGLGGGEKNEKENKKAAEYRETRFQLEFVVNLCVEVAFLLYRRRHICWLLKFYILLFYVTGWNYTSKND